MAPPPLVAPLLVLNLGSEMAFVVEQQLRNKKTPRTRRVRELRALLRALHTPAFLSALFHQTDDPVDPRALRGLLGRLANAPPSLSVNARAMDALYAAIRRGVARQLVAVGRDASLVLSVTLNHLDATKRMAEGTQEDEADRMDADVGRLVDETILRTYEVYGSLDVDDWRVLRRKMSALLAVGDRADVLESEADRDEYSRVTGRSVLDGDTAAWSVDEIVAEARRRVGGRRDDVRASPKLYTASAGDAMELLAELLGAASTALQGDDGGWRFTLFDDAKRGENDQEDQVETLQIDARSEQKEIASLRAEWAVEVKTKQGSKLEEEEDEGSDDLLGLMDKTCT